MNSRDSSSSNSSPYDGFKEYLQSTHREKSLVCRLSYAKRYYHRLMNGNAIDIQTISNDKRLEVMKSLFSVLFKFTDCYDNGKISKIAII